MNNIRLFIFSSLIIISTFSAINGKPDIPRKPHAFQIEDPLDPKGLTNVDQFICPPCGCSGDSLILSAPGTCTHCSMDLIKLRSGIQRDAQLSAAFLFRNAQTYAKFYLRIIYPLIVFELLFAIFMLTKIGKSQRLLFFSVFILSLSLYMLKFQLYGTSYAITRSAIALFAPISFLLWVWPSLYFFLRQGIERKDVEFKQYYIHFIPGGIFFIVQIMMFLSYPGSMDLLYNQFDSIFNPIEQVLFVAGGFYYGRLISMLYKPREYLTPTNTKMQRKANVFVSFIYAVSIMFATLILINFLLYNGKATTLDYHLIWLLFTLFIPWFCFEAWKNKTDFMVFKKEAWRFSKDRIEELRTEFDHKIHEGEMYQNPKFGLSDAASILSISPREMTEFISRAYRSNFYELINSHRVESAKKKLLSSDYDHLTNEAIGQSCGFGSRTTFIKSFKMSTGLTPKEFKRSEGLQKHKS